MTTKNDIKNWFIKGKTDDIYSHMIIVCDTYDYEDYPIYVKTTDNIHEVIKIYDNVNMQKIMEIYKFDIDMNKQLEHHRSYNI